MGKRLSSAAFGLGLLLLAACNAGKPAPPPSPPPRLAEVEKLLPGNNAFALDLYAKLARKEGNLFFSPLSVSAALAMTYAGASGQTAEQIARTCHFPEPDRLHEGFRNLLQTANAEGADLSERPYELRVANALWGQRGVAWREEFVNLTRRSYGAGLREVDFADSGKARAAINDWAAEQTSGRIPELLPDGLLNADTRMVLTNAVYFKGRWEEPFDRNRTRDQPFFTGPDASVQVPFMSQKGYFRLYEGKDLQVLALSYAGGELDMLILLPAERDGLPNLEKNLSRENVAAWADHMGSQEVIVELPKFRLATEYDLKGTLREMGMPDAFEPEKADFSRMNGDAEPLFIQAVRHKAFVEVNEEGTEAAAATGVAVAKDAAPEKTGPRLFRADHPFLFLIRGTADGGILFAGRVADPSR